MISPKPGLLEVASSSSGKLPGIPKAFSTRVTSIQGGPALPRLSKAYALITRLSPGRAAGCHSWCPYVTLTRYSSNQRERFDGSVVSWLQKLGHGRAVFENILLAYYAGRTCRSRSWVLARDLCDPGPSCLPLLCLSFPLCQKSCYKVPLLLMSESSCSQEVLGVGHRNPLKVPSLGGMDVRLGNIPAHRAPGQQAFTPLSSWS